ncbi:uncharacterized protein LOC133837573 isoform X1 [Drosophila sulfurigaster albostrigata]|uniref:uncharacterized protein LOC133837573 isoform X1 n=2 Tax=Drosophila sulfurigaster albostrigata TaxID=89887 RepID=UPI002D21ED3A|nr:uncharacterized protein LOC133837573 isoform X1 [Drosophila sulfurigaster albostrigata]
MEYGNGNGQYQSMEGYGMSAPDGQCPEIGQDYDQSRCYGGGSQYDDSRGYQNSSASFGGPGYRSPLRYNKVMREMNSRNGLYAPSDRNGPGRGNGDYYNSLPGIGGYESQAYQPRNSGNNPYY